YTIQPSAEIVVHWQLDWAAAETNLWEIGLSLPAPAGYDHQSWSRESYFTAYPPGHIGAPHGASTAKDGAFAASKRSLHYLTLANAPGTGFARIASDAPLVGRAMVSPGGTTLFASREVAAAGPDDLSQSWFHSHDIHAISDKPLSGAFVLRAIDKQ